MFDLTKAEELVKATRSIGGFFFKQAAALEKTHALHSAVAAHHNAMAAEHTTHAANYKAHHDGLEDGDAHKAMYAKGHTHHVTMAAQHDGISKAHAAHAESMKSEIDAMKAAAAEWGVTKADGPVTSLLTRTAAGTVTAPPTTPTGNVMVDMVNETSAQLMAKTLSMMDTDPEVQKAMREQVLKMISEAIGKTVIPTAVSAVAPPRAELTAVPRHGAPPTPAPAVDKSKIPLEFQKLFSNDEEQVERPVL